MRAHRAGRKGASGSSPWRGPSRLPQGCQPSQACRLVNRASSSCRATRPISRVRLICRLPSYQSRPSMKPTPSSAPRPANTQRAWRQWRRRGSAPDSRRWPFRACRAASQAGTVSGCLCSSCCWAKRRSRRCRKAWLCCTSRRYWSSKSSSRVRALGKGRPRGYLSSGAAAGGGSCLGEVYFTPSVAQAPQALPYSPRMPPCSS